MTEHPQGQQPGGGESGSGGTVGRSWQRGLAVAVGVALVLGGGTVVLLNHRDAADSAGAAPSVDTSRTASPSEPQPAPEDALWWESPYPNIVPSGDRVAFTAAVDASRTAAFIDTLTTVAVGQPLESGHSLFTIIDDARQYRVEGLGRIGIDGRLADGSSIKTVVEGNRYYEYDGHLRAATEEFEVLDVPYVADPSSPMVSPGTTSPYPGTMYGFTPSELAGDDITRLDDGTFRVTQPDWSDDEYASLVTALSDAEFEGRFGAPKSAVDVSPTKPWSVVVTVDPAGRIARIDYPGKVGMQGTAYRDVHTFDYLDGPAIEVDPPSGYTWAQLRSLPLGRTLDQVNEDQTVNGGQCGGTGLPACSSPTPGG